MNATPIWGQSQYEIGEGVVSAACILTGKEQRPHLHQATKNTGRSSVPLVVAESTHQILQEFSCVFLGILVESGW